MEKNPTLWRKTEKQTNPKNDESIAMESQRYIVWVLINHNMNADLMVEWLYILSLYTKFFPLFCYFIKHPSLLYQHLVYHFLSPDDGLSKPKRYIAQSAEAVEYTDCTSAEGQYSPNECPGYDTKQSDGEVQVMLELWEMLCTP